jgi:AbrB family looped-hinge helix DNA binding protein
MATGTLRKWGNSQGTLIPKSYCDHLGIKPGDRIDLSLEDDKIMIKPDKEFTLASLMEGYIGPMPEEFDWGMPMGKEFW